MLKPGRSLFITRTVNESLTSLPMTSLHMSSSPSMDEIVNPEPSNEMIVVENTSIEAQLPDEPRWPGNPPAHVAYIETPFVTPDIILNSKYLITNSSITLPSDPLLDGREVVIYNNSIQSIIVRANLDGIFEICPHTTCRLAYLVFVNLWVVV